MCIRDRDNGWHVGITGKGWGPGIANDAKGKPRLITGRPFNQRKAKPPTPAISNNDYAANFAEFLEANRGTIHPEVAAVARQAAGVDATALGDVLLGEQLWYREEEVTGTWSVYLAPSVRDVAFPELPPALAAFALQASDVISNTKAVHQDFAEVDGFNAAIEKGVPELGEVSFEQYYTNQCLLHDIVGCLAKHQFYVAAVGDRTQTGTLLTQTDVLFLRRS